MSRNGSGTYSLPVNSWNPATNGTPATAADYQALINDVAAAITQSLSKDGQTAMTGNLPAGGNKITGLAAGTTAGDSARFEQLPSATNILAVASGGTGLGTGENLAIVGEIKMWGTGTAPMGYLLCNGAAVSRATYSALFTLLSTTFGVGDGATTFNVPDFRDRMPIGAGTTYSANSSGGSANAVVVSHTHTATSTDAGHVHGVDAFATAGGGGLTTGVQSGAKNTGSGFANITTTVDAAGVSGTNANLPPYRGIYFIIKT